MAINLKFDLMGNPEPPSIVLANRSGNKLGQLKVNVESIDVKDKFNDISEFSFTLNKYTDGELTPLWDKVVDFKLVNCQEWDLWFEIKVELDETTETVKTVYCTQLGQAELSQIMVYNIEINTEADIEREDYKTSILYDEKNPKSSILHRLLEKAPHYSIAYVDESIQRIQRQFSFDGTSIYDAFNEIAEEIGCLFVYNSNSQAGGKPARTISVYDLQQNCNNKDCKHRGEFTDKCPKCGSTDIKYGYGEDTTIFVTADELATEGIQLVTDTDSVKNCFKLEAGDDLMTATIRNCNPNGSDYIWYFSESMKEDMSKELVDRIESYDAKYQEYYNSKEYYLDENLVNKYNELVDLYDDDYNANSTCLDCGNKGSFEEQCSDPNCNSKNILIGEKLKKISPTIKGYPDLMTAYYNTIDLLLYLKSSRMPNVKMSKTDAKEQISSLSDLSLAPIAVNVKDIKNASEATANSAVLSMAKVLIKPTYKVEVVDDSSSLSENVYYDDKIGGYKIWKGKFIITNYSDDSDTATSEEIKVSVSNATETFIKQKIEKTLNKEETDDYSVARLFKKTINLNENGEHIVDENGNCIGANVINENGEPQCPFCAELKKYALNPLDSFYKISDSCISILTEQGVGNEGSDLYNELYLPYYRKSQAIAKIMEDRENEIAIIEGVYNESDEEKITPDVDGLQTDIAKVQSQIQDELNFENHLGEDLWLEFCAYRREDKYSNSNYISDGLNNAELFKKANEFIGVAEEEIFKSAELQHSISATLNNLLALPKFKPLLESFKTGNWIRVQADDKVYKLRLLEYDFGYGDIENISVEFSDVTKIKNGTTDVQDVFEQASSMASSYDSVQRQAKKGDVARSTIDQWIVDGLNSANVEIKSNNSEEVLLTKSGLLARSYDDITGTYSPEQLKITHNIMAYTDDNWETVSSALGKHNYKKWDNDSSSFIDDEDYGLSAKFAQAAYIIGSQMIGGEIVSSNYQPETQGTHINLLNGEFDFAGGKIVYDIDADDPEKSTLTLKGVTIQWDGDDAVNPPVIENITGLNKEIDKINKTNNALFSTTISEKSVISPLIVGGYLNIKNDADKTGVIIDPNKLVNNDYVFRVYNGDTTAIGLDVDGNAEFSGTIKSSNIIGESTLQVGAQYDENNNVTGYLTTIDSSGRLTCVNADISGDITADSLTLRKQIQLGNEDDGYHTWINPDGTLSTQDANISGEIRAASGQIGGFTIKPDENNKTYGWLYSGANIGEDKSIFLSATDMTGTMSFSQPVISTDNDGDIVYDENGDVVHGNTTLSLTKSNWRITVGSNFGITSDGTAYMSNCEIVGGSLKMGSENSGYYAWISEDGVLNAGGANIGGTITAVNGYIGNWKINQQRIESVDGNTLLVADDSVKYSSLIDGDSYVRFSAGGEIDIPAQIQTVTELACTATVGKEGGMGWTNVIPINCKGALEDVRVSEVRMVHISNGTVAGFLPDTDYNATVDYANKTLTIEIIKLPTGATFSYCYLYVVYDYTYKVTLAPEKKGCPAFKVLKDGSLYANVANIKGHIEADSGTFNGTVYANEGNIGKLKIDNGVKGYVNGTESFSLTADGLLINNSLANLQIGNLKSFYDTSTKNTYLQTNGALSIRGMKQGQVISSIELMTQGSNSSEQITVDINIVASHFEQKNNDRYMDLWLELKETSDSTHYPITIVVYYEGGYDNVFGRQWFGTNSVSLTLPADSTKSNVQTVRIGNAWTHLLRVGDSSNLSEQWVADGLPSNGYNYEYKTSLESITQFPATNNIVITGNLVPSVHSDTENTGYSLGLDGMRWNNIFAYTSTITTSDKNVKNTIADISNEYNLVFDNLKPVSYKYNNNTNNRTHIGFIAQDVKDAIFNAGLTTQDFAGYCEWTSDDGVTGCGLRYEEFIALCVDEIQKLKKRVAELENK